MLIPTLGFFGGFILGLIAIKIMLKDKTKEELRRDKTLHKKYGTLVWGFALLGLLIGIAVKPFFL